MARKVMKPLRPAPIDRVSRPFLNFLAIEASGGVILLICTVIALYLANSPWADTYASFWEQDIALSFGDLKVSHSLKHWINDALMTIFFFVVGLEIKRELVVGEMKDLRTAVMPAMAALGGMLAPALIYLAVIDGRPGLQAWGIPMATDIAFVVGFMALLGNRVPHRLKIFLLSLAIVDDIGAILIIAMVYNSEISYFYLFLGTMGLVFTTFLNRIGVRRVPIYVFVGAVIWVMFAASGIHPTIAGVLLGLLTPGSAWVGDRTLLEALSSFRKAHPEIVSNLEPVPLANDVNHMIHVARESVSPLERLELALHPWVAFFIMPIFALANAGVPLALEAAQAPVSLAVISGLVVGKPLGILIFCWITVKFLKIKLHPAMNWRVLLGGGFLAGVGFTMSIFVAGLALDSQLLVAGKVGTLIGSATSAILGLGILFWVLPKAEST